MSHIRSFARMVAGRSEKIDGLGTYVLRSTSGDSLGTIRALSPSSAIASALANGRYGHDIASATRLGASS